MIVLLFTLLAVSAVAQPVEKLTYNLKYSFLKGGEAVLIVNDTTYQGNKALHYYMQGNTVGLAETLYKVDDVYESIVNPETILPYMAIRNIKERKYRYYNETYFFNDNDSVFSQRSGGKKVPHNLVDMLSIFFYLRQHNLLESMDHGEEITLPVYHADKHFMLTTTLLGTETIDSEMGKKECFVVSPRVDKGKLLKRSDGLKFYITKDKNKIPLLLEFDMKVGALKAELVSYEKNGVEQLK